MEQRPKRGIGIAVVIFLDILRFEVNRRFPDAVAAGDVRPREFVLLIAGPAAPGAATTFEHRFKRTGQTALRTGRPRPAGPETRLKRQRAGRAARSRNLITGNCSTSQTDPETGADRGESQKQTCSATSPGCRMVPRGHHAGNVLAPVGAATGRTLERVPFGIGPADVQLVDRMPVPARLLARLRVIVISPPLPWRRRRVRETAMGIDRSDIHERTGFTGFQRLPNHGLGQEKRSAQIEAHDPIINFRRGISHAAAWIGPALLVRPSSRPNRAMACPRSHPGPLHRSHRPGEELLLGISRQVGGWHCAFVNAEHAGALRQQAILWRDQSRRQNR